uniref:Uncharacterized protein n=1 Tax=viral metagenome TaxID=1070528 RepID=A0A6C0LX86_9ZZZZ
MSYSKNTKFFNTGFLPSYSNKLRLQQGLQSQEFANVCAYKNITVDSPSSLIVAKSSGLAGTPITMYPTPVSHLPTCGKPIPSSDPCTQWVKAP